MKTRKTQSEYYQDVKKQYIAEGNRWPAPISEIIGWAEDKGLLETPKSWRTQYHLDKMRRALREEYHTDPQGRRVRTNHPYPVDAEDSSGSRVQKTFWSDIFSMQPEQMRRSVQTRRKQSLGEVKQIKTDLDSYNDNNEFGAFIQASFNFDKDLKELSQDTEYNPDPSGESEPPRRPK